MSTTTTTAATASPSSAQGLKNQFLKILLTQMKTQNPLDPMKPEQFASQLAQFSSLEQQVDTNSKLDSLITALNKPAAISPLSYMNTEVDYTSDTAPVQNGKAKWSYATSGAATVNIVVKDANGTVVYSGTGDATAGLHKLEVPYTGTNTDGKPLTVTVTAKDASGKVITPMVAAHAKITGVDMSGDTPLLSASGLLLNADLVSRITASS